MPELAARLVETTVDGKGETVSSTWAAPRITVSFERKVNLGNYESASVFVSMQVDNPIESDEDRIAAINNAFLLVRSSAYEQLGIQFSIDDAMIVQEKVERVFGPVTVVDKSEHGAETTYKQSAPRSDTVAPKTKRALWEELESNPEKWYDNRDNKTNPKSPDFKRKATGEGLWIEYQGASSVPKGITLP